MLRHRLEGQPRVCPYCGPGTRLRRLRRKKFVLDILKCESCELIFRWPVESEDEADAYYQAEYGPAFPQVRLPDGARLRELMAENFAGSDLDLNAKIRVLKALRPEGRVLDYGASWGYGTYQLQQHGFDASGFEISRPRARFARERIGLKMFDSLNDVAALPDGSFDVIFSNHVLEHLPNLQEVFAMSARLLATGGIAFHVLPNFTGKRAREGAWIMWIGEEHPVAPTIEFFRRNLPLKGFSKVLFGSEPFNGSLAAALARQDGHALSAEGDELLVVAHK